MLEPGALIAGKLRVERILGEGGMGTVALATHIGLDQRVAIKVLKPELANQPDVVARFTREARAAAKLKSEHVCRVTDVGETAEGEVYIEMEYLEGHDLAAQIMQHTLAVDIAADYIVQACVAIAEAHHLGIVHRDLKPANLFVTARLDGTALIKVLDFGIATAPSAEDFKITKTTTVMGSPGYMSPEHLRSARDVDVRSDIWALGVILYEAVTGRLPFSATSITELAVKVVMDEPEALANVDPRYAAIVARCLKKPPEERYQNVGDLAADLAAIGTQATQTTSMLVSKLLGGGTSRKVSVPSPAVGLAPTLATLAPRSSTAPAAAAAPVKPSTTTLGSAASSSFAAPDDVPRTGRGKLIAASVIGVLAAAAAAFAFVMHDTTPVKPVRPAHRAGSNALAHETPPASDAGAVYDVKVRELVKQFAANKEYQTVLETALTDPGDPEIGSDVAEARTQYLATQLKELATHAAAHDCADAKLEASTAERLVPDAKAEIDKAATCTPKPKPTTTATTTPAATSEQAVDEYTKGDYKAALATAQQVLKRDPNDHTAPGVLVRAACELHDEATAKANMELVPGDERLPAIATCHRNGIKVMTDVSADALKHIQAGNRAVEARDWATAETEGKAAVKLEPNYRDAEHLLGTAACHLHHDAEYQQALQHLGARAQQMLRRACQSRDN
ncbi:MAG TPA: serine/threonine-protein kinase [Kofleriaceae bacterium]|nr:serine/threonine-protein kinase [Kofleriaceae bacterium]